MVTAHLTAHDVVFIGNLKIAISFAQDVTGFSVSDLNIGGTVTGNGITGITTALTGADKNYTLSVMLPEGKRGSFSVDISGQVLVDGQAQDVLADAITVHYDTVRKTTATFGELRYQDAEALSLRIVFNESIFWFDKTDLMLTKIAGDTIYSHNHNLIGKENDYRTIFRPAQNTAGAFKVDITGKVLKTQSSVREVPSVTPKLIVYNNIMPVLVDIGTPEQIAPHVWNTCLAFNVPIVGLGIQKFIYGVQTEGTPALYRAVSLDVKPPPLPLVGEDNLHLNACIGDWVYEENNHNSRVQSKYWTLRFKTPVEEIKTPEIFLKEHAVLPAR